MNDVQLKKIIEECVGNNDPYWNNPVYEVVKKIINMSDGEESSVGKLLSNINDYGSTQLFDIDNTVTEVCNKLGIKLDKTKHAGQVSGLPWNISFVIKRMNEQEAKKITLEQMIKENAGSDPFWEECINDFFNNVNKTEDEKIEFFKKLSLDQHLFNEFTREIVKSLNKDQIFEKYNKLLNNNNVDEFILKIKEYTVSYENKNSYIVLITNEKIQINNEQVKEDITAKVNKIKNIVLENLNEIDKISNSVQHSYKGGRQKKIDIRINGKDYYIIGNTSNEEAVKLYSILKEKIYKTINNESDVEKNIPRAIKRILKCPNCGAGLTYLMPSGSYLSCVKCKKIYTNEKGHVGHETSFDYDKNSNILY